jgi:hypothetical protein
MAKEKLIAPIELYDILGRLLLSPESTSELKPPAKFRDFYEDLAAVVCKHCGGKVSEGPDLHEHQWLVKIARDEKLPMGSDGVWALYDQDVKL